MQDSNRHTFYANSGALAANRRVSINSSNKLVYAGPGTRADGTLQTDIDSTVVSKSYGTIIEFAYGQHWGHNSGASAIAIGDELEAAANGMITKRVAGALIGVALEAIGAVEGGIRYLPKEQTADPVAGQGGKVTQITSASTGVTLSKRVGQITTVALTTAGGAEETFTVTNTTVEAQDIIPLSTTYNGAGTPAFSVKNVTNGSFDIVITNLHASNALNALMVINFRVLKGAVDADLA
jgi:hypothetical protein